MRKIPPTDPVGWQDFGQFLFNCRESDPGYFILNHLREDGYSQIQLKRFAVAWTSYYNLGIAAKASEMKGPAFYKYLEKVYPTATRASERRHFRGASGLRALHQWQEKWPNPDVLADFIMDKNMGAIREHCDHVLQMGDYFKWKWGDLSEVLLQKSVEFRGYENVSPKVPQQGAALIAEEAGKPEMSTAQVYRAIAKQMNKLDVESPYAPWRAFNVQDAETICCVYKQYRSGGYVPGLRTAKAVARLQADGAGCRTANRARMLLLEKQPVLRFRDPDVLGRILEGIDIFDVREFV